MMMHFIHIICIAAIAYTWVNILTAPDMILNREKFSVYLTAEKHLPSWLFKPLIGCDYCVSGQIGLWYYLVKYLPEYSLESHAAYILLSIFTVEIIRSIINLLNK
jgi:hypothetical protein